MMGMVRFRKHWRKFAIVAIAGITLITIALIMTASHWWKKVSEAIITYNGQLSPGSSIYRSRDGNLLVDLREQQGEGLYIIQLESREIGISNLSSFFMLPGYAYSKNVPPLYAPMGKAEVDPDLVVQPGLTEFNSIKKARVHVTW